MSLKELSGKDEEIVSYLMESLDDKGYLDEPSESVAERFGEPVERIEKIVAGLQALEPAGVFARNLGRVPSPSAAEKQGGYAGSRGDCKRASGASGGK